MAMIGRLLACLVCAFALIGWPPLLSAEERINDYQVDIEVMEDGLLEVTEHMLITSEGEKIVHGITREIPLAFIAADGHRARSTLTVLGIERDGEPEDYQVIETSRGVVLRIGRSDVELAPDVYQYTIQYQINRVINYSDDHDWLIWNVNGNEGQFPIEALSARVSLPHGAEPLATEVYTGRYGETGDDAYIEESGGEVVFEASRPLEAGENMTIKLMLPKGVIQPPDEATLDEWRAQDLESTNSAAFTAMWCAFLAGLLWLMFGRDPRPGVIVPRWDVPEGMSPGRVNYSVSRNFESGYWTGFSAAVIDLAVKGKVVLENLADGITVRKIADGEEASLPTEQAAILKRLPPGGQPFSFRPENADKTHELGEAFYEAVVTDLGDKFYRPRTWVWVSFALLMLAVMVVRESDYATGVDYVDGWLPGHWVPAIVAWFFATVAIKKWRALVPSSRPGLKKRLSILINLFLCGATVLVALAFYADAPVPRDNFLLAFLLFMISTLLWAFIGRVSRKGRKVMDEIEGLTMYLELAEKDRMNLVAAPEMSPAHYETLLPYAVALGVERPWSQLFQASLARPYDAETPVSYRPAWYVGRDVERAAKEGELSEFFSSFSSRVQNSLPSESDSYDSGSSSSSGSGRGGGGVGGW